MAFDILMNGVGNAFALENWGTHFLLRRGDFLLGVDCPDSYRRALQDNGFEGSAGEALDVDALDGMVITHLHGDHVNGLEMVLAYRRYVVEEKLELYSSPEVCDVLWDQRLAVSLGTSWDGEQHQTLAPDDYYWLNELPWQTSTTVGPFQIETRRTVHHVTTMAMRITDGDATLGYSCDTAYDPDLIDWLADCDLILHETSYGPGHTPLFKLLELGQALKNKLVVVHLPDELAGVEDEVDVEFARQGKVYSVR